MANKILNPSWRRFSGSHSQASVGVIVLIAFLLIAILLSIAVTSEPVQASPETFGYEGIGGLSTSCDDYIRGSLFTITEDGTADSITVYVRAESGYPYKCAIYRHSDGVLIGETEERSDVDGGGVGGWHTFNFSDPKPELVDGTEYVLAVWCNEYLGKIYYTAGDADQGHFKSIGYNSFPNPITWSSQNTNKYSIYCTYSTEEGPQEYERPVSQGFSLAGTAPRGAEFGRVIEQGFSFGAAVAIVMEICKLLSQTFGITGTVGVTSGLSRSLAQDFSLDESVESKRELGKSVAQDFSLTGEVEAVVDKFAQEYERPIEQGFSLAATIDVDIQWVPREFERDVAQGFSFEGTVIGHEYGDIYITSPWCNGKVNPIVAVDPIFSAIYTVTDNNIPNPAMFIQIQVGTSWDDNDLWDNITAVMVENGQRSPDVTYAGSTLTVNSVYWWRCRLKDSNGNWTEWTPPQMFGYAESPFDLVAAAMFLLPIVLMGIALAFDNPVFASLSGMVFIISGFYFIDTLWLALIFIGVGVYLLITAFMSEED